MVDRFTSARKLMQEADEIGNRAGFVKMQLFFNDRHSHNAIGIYDEKAIERFTKKLDGKAWEFLMKESGLYTFMDSKARKDWNDSLHEGKYPELTKDNIRATFEQLHATRGDLLERGVISCFKSLSWDYKTNQPSRFSNKLILDRLVTYYHGSSYTPNSYMTNALDDLIRAFCLFEDKPEPDHRRGIYYELGNTTFFDGEYFSIKIYKKGSGHLVFKKPELVDKLNLVLAKHYPNSLPQARKS